MKRLVYLISTFLILTGYSSVVSPQQWTRLDETGNSISEFHERYRDQYLDLSSQPGVKSSLATSPNGCWAAFAQYFSTQQTVKALALHKCKTYCSATCTIVDINGTSAFIKQRGSSGSSSADSSTASSSDPYVWCATPHSVARTVKSWCRRNGKAFSTVYQAKAEHKRLKGSKVWCANKYWTIRLYRSVCTANRGKYFDTQSEALAEHKRLKVAPSSYSGSKSVWCATEDSITWIREKYCRQGGGRAYSYKTHAKAEHKRLEAARLLAKKKAEEEAARQLAKKKAEEEEDATSVVDRSVELAFWTTIQESDDPDMYREYLLQFPEGVYAGLAKLKVKKLGGTSTLVAQSSIPNLDYGDYYALVIGNNRYQHLGNLRTAINDARSVANLLEVDYGFNVTKLENANREQIIDSISGLRSKVTSEDNVLIYYAGHGYLDEAADEGFWLPTDSDRTNQSNWLATDRVVGQVRAMKAKHVMVVADSCFSGTITRGIKIEIKQPTREWLETIVKKKARTALTSGGLEPVMDSGSGNNSVFANSFLSILRDNDGVLDASQLFSQLRPKVMVNSDQTPEYGDIHRAGHDGGDFLFVRKTTSSVGRIVVGSATQTTSASGKTLNATPVSNVVSVSEQGTYDAAFDLLKQSLYVDAAVAFTQFIQRFPNSELTDDAWYWIGEARFVTREFVPSLIAFQKVINNFMDSPRIPASYLKVGYIQYEYAAYIEARETLNFVVSSFPNHKVVVNAKARLEKMAREGN